VRRRAKVQIKESLEAKYYELLVRPIETWPGSLASPKPLLELDEHLRGRYSKTKK
jgi:hypothetical protein